VGEGGRGREREGEGGRGREREGEGGRERERASERASERARESFLLIGYGGEGWVRGWVREEENVTVRSGSELQVNRRPFSREPDAQGT